MLRLPHLGRSRWHSGQLLRSRQSDTRRTLLLLHAGSWIGFAPSSFGSVLRPWSWATMTSA